MEKEEKGEEEKEESDENLENKEPQISDRSESLENEEIPSQEENIKLCGIEKDQPLTKEQIKKENKILRNILISIGIFVVFLIGSYYIIGSIGSFDYEGLDFSIVKEGEIIFYKVPLPLFTKKVDSITGNVISIEKTGEHNFYLRKDPRKSGEIPFNGELIGSSVLVINATNEFDSPNCDGYGIIAVANLASLYNTLGIKTMRDANATCDSEGRYMFIHIREAEESSIEKFGPSCYYLNVNNCEILDVTERFMLETFFKAQKNN